MVGGSEQRPCPTRRRSAQCGCSARRYTLSDERREEAGIRSGCAGSSGRLRGGHDYRHYPFDHQQTVVGAAGGTIPIILVPDVASYDRLHPAACPGIAADAQLTGRSGTQLFAYLRIARRRRAAAGEEKLSLGFVVQTRHSVSAIIAETLVVLLAIIAAIFLLLFVLARPARGYALSVIFHGGFALLALVAHLALRHHHPVPQVTYAGYLASPYDGVLLWQPPSPFAGRGEEGHADEARLLPSLLLGPGSLALLYLVTLAVLR